MSDLLEPVLDWAVGQLTRPGHVRSRVDDVAGLREGRSPWLVRLDDGTAAVLRVGDAQDEQQRDGFRIEATVLEAAREHGIPTSTLIAHDLTGEDCGALAVLPEHADPVLAGYLDARGRDDVADLAYWDIVAALSTPPRMAGFVSAIQDQGRPDLDQPVLEERRDAFLRSALMQIG